jgi:AAA domain
MNAEDSLEHTIKPRLVKLGACLKDGRIIAPDRYFTFDEEGLRWLQDIIKDKRPGFIIIDPLVAYLGAKMDMNAANKVREFSAAIAELAAKDHVAIVMVRHLKKARGGKAIYQGLGSIDFTGAARSELLVEYDEDAGVPVMSHIKCNVGPLGPSLAYKIDAEGFQWLGPVDVTGDELLEEPEERAARGLRNEAKGLMLKALGEARWLPTTYLYEYLYERVRDEIEVSDTTLERLP